MSNSYAFAFPKHHPTSFKLLDNSTVGYLSDSIFYRLDLSNGKSQALHHPEGRTYQAFTSLHKRGITVLADYGRNSNLYFFFPDSSRDFQIKNICPLQILEIDLSLDGKYLAVACGSPWMKVIFINVEERKVIGGSQNFIDLKGRQSNLIKIDFNPSNRRIISLSFKDHIQIYEIKDCLQMNEKGIQNSIIVLPRLTANVKKLQASVWDELGNIYLSGQNRLWIWSSETGKQLASYDIEQESQDNLVRSLILTQKHIIAFYSNGRAEWLIKFYPELLDEDSTLKPFQLDRYHEGAKKVVHALYDHQFSKILMAYDDGFLGVLNVPAEFGQSQEDEQDGQGKKKKRQPKKYDVQNSFIGPYHRSRMILIHQIESTSLVITVSINGRVILWSTKQRKQIGYFDTDGFITSADINNKHNVLAVARQDGTVQFYSIHTFQNPFIFKQFRITKGPIIDQILFSSSGQELAVLSKKEERVYYILTALTMPFQILGYVALPHSPFSIAWHVTQRTAIKPKHQYLLVSIGYGVLMLNGPAAVPAKKRGQQLNLPVQIYALRTDLQQYLVCSLPSGEILTTGEDKFIKRYRQPQQLLAKVDFKSKFPIPPPIEELQAHNLRITRWKCRDKYFVSASADGSVQFREISNLNQFKTFQAAGWKKQNIGYVAPSSNGGIYTGSYEGCFQVWRGEGEALTDQFKAEEITFKHLPKERQTKYFEVMIQEEYLQRMKQAISGKKKVQMQKLAKIRQQLQMLLLQNQSHDQLEKLSRDQFAIDLQSREKVAQAGREKCLKIRQESRIKILKNEIVAKKLKQITWDRMEVHLKAINGLKNNFVVFNYQLKRISKDDKRILQIIFDLRRAQRKEQKKRQPQLNYEFYSNKNVVNGGILQPLILGGATIEKKEQKKEEKGKKKKEDEQAANQVEQAQQIFNEEQWGLLYNSFQLYSDNAKRNQIVMMKHMIIRIKEAFNKQFQKILKLRQNQNQLINDKNKRIEQICEQLKRPNEVIRSRKNILQSNESVLQVLAQQIPFKRYLSKQERQKVERERLKEEQRQRKLLEDDSSQRALQKMMAGTLEQKKTSVLQVTVERQKWMEKPLQQMSEEQKSKMKEYEQKRQKAEEEKERIVKKLQAQLRKLKQQIDDVMQKYDEKLFALVKRRLQYDYRIQQQQLYCTRLFLSVSNVKQQQNKQKQLIHQLESSKNKVQNLSSQQEALKAQQEELQKTKEAKHAALDARKLGDIQSKIKTIEKSIFEEFQSNHKKRRQLQEKLLQSQPKYRNLLVPLDPMKDIESKNLSSQKAKDFHFFINQIKVLQQTYDIPEGSLIQILQNRFNIRREEGELQTKIKILKDTLLALQEKHQESGTLLQKEEEELTEINVYLQRAQSDLQIEIRIKQGQVELNNQKPVPELNDALLISKGQIDDKNSKIIVNANQKIKVMEQIKTCKISVTEETLNLQKKEDMINKLNSMIKQIQMLKVKKEMQVALAKKDTKINQNEIKSLKEQIQKVRKQGEKRISLFETKIQKIKQEIETIKKENKQLDTQKWNLEQTVKQRQKIKEMMVGQNGEGNQEAKQKFQQIAINRKLFDRAKQQTQEIELLRQELSKLKAKTFANFSNAQR